VKDGVPNMWNKISQTVSMDMLFNLLLAFIALFYITFIMISIAKQENKDAKSDNNILITMRWKTDNDMDLWLKLPDERKVWYSNRDEPPAHLDVDVVAWRRYKLPDGKDYEIKNNEEIITIRDILSGEYAVNVHYFSARNVDPAEPIEVEVLVQDVKNKTIIYFGTKTITMKQPETHFVRFTIELMPGNTYQVKNVYTDRPTYFVGGPNMGNRGQPYSESGRGEPPHINNDDEIHSQED